MGRKRSTFVDFVDKNEDLAKEYEQTVGEDLWSLPIQKIEEIAGAIASKMKIGFSSVLNNCVNISIQTQTPLLKVLSDLLKSDAEMFGSDSSLQKYFKEINQIYTQNNNDYDIPFTQENRDKIISMNLKSVIAIAKCYQGLGVEFQDLISAGNEGLCRAFNKFDPKRSCLKDDVKNAINQIEKDMIEYNELLNIINDYLTYGDSIRKSFDNKFKEGNIYTKIEILKWVVKNITNAKFNSVACKWIKAYIIQEINNNSRIVKKPKTEIDKDKELSGAYQKEVIINIDAPITSDENSKTIGDMIMGGDDTIAKDSLENEENYKAFKRALNILLTGVKSRDRRIILKKFGIGVIRPLQPNEIAIQEDLSVARISQIINSTIEIMIENSKKYKNQLDIETIFDALSKLV
jgi:RNA polymerase sigma factor (sigma-70 family)